MVALENVIKVTQSQYDDLINGKEITVNGQKYTFDTKAIYCIVDPGNYVPQTRTINSKALTQNITLTASDVSALPNTTTYVRSINGKSGNITLTYSDFGAISTDTSIVRSLSDYNGSTYTGAVTNVCFRTSDNKFSVQQHMPQLYITNSRSSGVANFFVDSEGGNIDLHSPNGGKGSQMDCYNNSLFRIYLYDVSPWAYKNDLVMNENEVLFGGTSFTGTHGTTSSATGVNVYGRVGVFGSNYDTYSGLILNSTVSSNTCLT